MNKCAIVTLQGMGKIDPNYHLPVEKALDKEFGPIGWRDHNNVMEKLKETYPLRWNLVRNFMLYGFSNAGTIGHGRLVEPETYDTVLLRVRTQIFAANQRFGDEGGKNIVLAHSL